MEKKSTSNIETKKAASKQVEGPNKTSGTPRDIAREKAMREYQSSDNKNKNK